MKPSLLEHLACPRCGSGLRLDQRQVAAGGGPPEVMEGELSCAGCGRRWPIRAGVPRFVQRHESLQAEKTAAAFGWEWQVFSEITSYHERQFLDWIAPAGPDRFSGRVVLEGGCGKGRHTRLAARWGAKAVIGVDLSDAVDVAFSNTRELPNAHVLQADLCDLPLRPGSVDYAFSVGVIHHLPEPERGFVSLARAVRSGGAISVWVYGAENNGWIARVVSPLRRAITSRLPPRLLYGVSWMIGLALLAALRAIYLPLSLRPAGRLDWLRRRLFYYPYLSYVSPFPFREIHHIVHDHLAAPVAHYLRREEVESWYRRAGARDVIVAWHNQNSWRGFGVLPASGGAGPAGPPA